MNQNEEMPVRILSHAAEILGLLTGEVRGAAEYCDFLMSLSRNKDITSTLVSVLQHLADSRIKIQLNNDKKMVNRILSHALEIIFLLTGEEYTIVKKKSPHSPIQQLTGECEDAAVSLTMEVWDQTEGQNALGNTSALSQGHRAKTLNTVSINEDGEYEREENDILQVTIHSDTCADGAEMKPEIVSKLELNEELERGHLQVKEEDIPISISEGLSNLKQSIFLGYDQEVEQIKMEETPLFISKDAPINITSSGRHNSSQASMHSEIRENDATKCHHGVVQDTCTSFSNGSKYVQNVDKEFISDVEERATEIYLSMDKDNANEEAENTSLKMKNEESSKVVENYKNVLAKKNYSCEYGKNVLSYNSQLQSIVTICQPFTCSECGKCFQYRSQLVHHENVHTGVKPFACPKCGKCFGKKSNLVQHERVHTAVKPFICSQCGKCFRYKSELVHHESVHTGVKPFACSECGKCFRKKSNLAQHERVHTGVKPFECPQCGLCFRYKSELVNHKSVHTGVKPFVCSKCGKCFIHKSSLVDHEKNHTGVKPFPCPECGKCFSKKSNLVEHERVHTGVKPFACSECGKCFSQISVLVTHERIHTGVKPFACSQCGKCFSQKSSLSYHEKIHTGVRPFACSECGKCFISNTLCTRHQLSHTKKIP